MLPTINLGFIQLPSFYLVISLTISILLFWLSQRLENSTFNSQQNRKIAFNISIILMVFGFLGARLFHVIYEEWPYYQAYPVEIFKFWNGGFVFFGGLILALIASVLYIHKIKENFWKWADFLSPLIASSYALGRLGCFLEGCCYGTLTNLPWAVGGRHPVQIYMSLTEFLIVLILLKVEKSKKLLLGQLFLSWIILHSLSRFAFEFLRADERGQNISVLSISQMISLVLIIWSGKLFKIASRRRL